MSDPLEWVKSTYSASGNCVEIAVRDDVLVRDTNDRRGPVLAFRPEVWHRFAEQVKGGSA